MKRRLILLSCPHDQALEYVHELVHNSQDSASLRLQLDLAHALHANYARPDIVYVLHHEDSARQLDHDPLGTKENLLSVHLWNEDQSSEDP